MKKGSDVLIHAGASGVGVAAIQLARKYRMITLMTVQVGEAKNVYTTCGTDDKVKFLQRLAEKVHAINYKTESASPHIELT